MQRAVGAGRAAYGIGLVYGLVAGSVGVVQWVLTAHDLDVRYAEFQVLLRQIQQEQYPDYTDSTNIVMDNQYYWLRTAVCAGLALLVIYWLAAYTAARASRRQHEGIVAARVAVAVGTAVYVAASVVVHVTGPFSSDTAGILVWEPIIGLAFVGVALVRARAAAAAGERSGTRSTHSRQAF